MPYYRTIEHTAGDWCLIIELLSILQVIGPYCKTIEHTAGDWCLIIELLSILQVIGALL